MRILSSIILLATVTAQSDTDCKTVTTVEDFDIEEYASKPWYVQQQAITTYSPPDRNYCTRAQYSLRDASSFWGYSISVDNYAQNEDGEEFGGPLCAFQPTRDGGIPSKLAVAPCFLPKFFAGPYWIVAYDEDEGYALVSGGQPTIPGETEGTCQTGTGTNGSGLWIFTRSQERDDGLVKKVRTIASENGFDLSVLDDVDQEGCVYPEDEEDVVEDEGDEEGDICLDSTDTFRFLFSERTCEWVGAAKFWRCALFGDTCPATCNRCD